MGEGRENEAACEIALGDFSEVQRLWRDRVQREEESPERPSAYHLKTGKATIRLDVVEFRILTFLATKPYRAFSAKAIVKAVSTVVHPVNVEDLDQHVASLRKKLGFFHNYVRVVPKLGYCFVA